MFRYAGKLSAADIFVQDKLCFFDIFRMMRIRALRLFKWQFFCDINYNGNFTTYLKLTLKLQEK